MNKLLIQQSEEDMFMASLICNLDVDCEKLLICKMDMDCIKALHFDTEVTKASRIVLFLLIKSMVLSFS